MTIIGGGINCAYATIYSMPNNILNITIQSDGTSMSLRDYLIKLLTTLWKEEDQFSGKRPFGNSGWQYDVYAALIQANLVEGALDEDGYVESINHKQADKLVLDAITRLGAT